MSEHARIAELVPFYASRVLDDEGRRRVEEHLPDCAECRDLLEHARLFGGLREYPADALTAHPHADHLDRFATDASTLDPRHASEIREHLAQCAACFQAVDLLRRTPELDVPRGRWGFGLLLSPRFAAAYLLLLLALPVAYVLLRRPEPEFAGTLDLPVISSALRGEDEERRIVVAPGSRFVALALEFEPPEGPSAVEVTIDDPAGRAIFTETLSPERVRSSLAETGVVALIVPASRLEGGSYRVHVAGPGGRPLLDAPFQVARNRAPP